MADLPVTEWPQQIDRGLDTSKYYMEEQRHGGLSQRVLLRIFIMAESLRSPRKTHGYQNGVPPKKP